MTLPQKKGVTRVIVATLTAVLTIGLFSGSSIQTTALADNRSVAEQSTEPQIDSVVFAQLQQEAHIASASNEVETVKVGVAVPTPTVATPPPLDRTKPIYTVYKNGYLINVPTDIQWYIRDMAEKYGFAEKYIYGCILAESGFNARAVGDRGKSFGLAQIQKFWIRGANITHFTNDYKNRDLLNPYHNILTMMEMWCYARDAYGINTGTESGMKDLLYWHNTGKFRKNVSWNYSNKVIGYSNELIQLQLQ